MLRLLAGAVGTAANRSSLAFLSVFRVVDSLFVCDSIVLYAIGHLKPLLYVKIS